MPPSTDANKPPRRDVGADVEEHVTLLEIEHDLEKRGLWCSWTSQVELTGKHRKKFTWIARIQRKNEVLAEVRRDDLGAARRAAYEALLSKEG